MTRRRLLLVLDKSVTDTECGGCCHAEPVADGWQCTLFGGRIDWIDCDTARHADCLAAEAAAKRMYPEYVEEAYVIAYAKKAGER